MPDATTPTRYTGFTVSSPLTRRHGDSGQLVLHQANAGERVVVFVEDGTGRRLGGSMTRAAFRRLLARARTLLGELPDGEPDDTGGEP